jgi:hypothetical protein
MLVAICCPDCGHRGWASDQKLPRALRCTGCGATHWTTLAEVARPRRSRIVDAERRRRWAEYDPAY